MAVKIRARDLNQDGKEELLILMEYGEHECNLHVFSENDTVMQSSYEWQGAASEILISEMEYFLNEGDYNTASRGNCHLY